MKKNVKFSTRMASADREAIKALAAQTGLSMSDYVTACCLGEQVVVIDGLKELFSAVRGIGNNLNQLTVLSHMGKVSVIGLERFSDELAKVNAALREIIERKRW